MKLADTVLMSLSCTCYTMEVVLVLMFVVNLSCGILIEDNDHQLLMLLKQEVEQLKMDHSAAQNEITHLKTELATVKNNTSNGQQPVSFMASLSHDLSNPATGHQIVFDTLHLNVGNAYNNRHGIFTAPVNGTYHFSVEISFPPASSQFHLVEVFLKRKSTDIAYIYDYGIWNYWIKRSATALVHLDSGDDVYAVVQTDNNKHTIAGGLYRSVFSGFLIL